MANSREGRLPYNQKARIENAIACAEAIERRAVQWSESCGRPDERVDWALTARDAARALRELAAVTLEGANGRRSDGTGVGDRAGLRDRP
jgi:hypothetical protein